MLATHEGAMMSKIKALLDSYLPKIIDDAISPLQAGLDTLRRDIHKLRPEDLYMLNDEEDYTDDVLGLNIAYQPPAAPPPPPSQAIPAAVPNVAPFYAAPPPVARGAQGTSTVTYGAPPQPQPQFFAPQFQPSPQPPLQPHQLGLDDFRDHYQPLISELYEFY